MLEFHRPVIREEKKESVKKQVADLKKHIKKTSIRELGFSGYQIFTSEARIRKFGINYITVKNSLDNQTMIGTINLIGEDYSFEIDNNSLSVKPTEGLPSFKTDEDQLWFELLVLAHLKKILCLRNDEIGNHLTGGEARKIKKGQRITQAAYMKLQDGRKMWYTTPADEAYQKSELIIRHNTEEHPIKNLGDFNQLHGRSKAIGGYTYARAVDRRVSNTPGNPVRLSFTRIEEELTQVISLDEISDEERMLIEAYILEDLINI